MLSGKTFQAVFCTNGHE